MNRNKIYFVMLFAQLVILQVSAQYEDCDESEYTRHKMTCKNYIFHSRSMRICTFRCRDEYDATLVPISICKNGKMDRLMPCELRDDLVQQCDATNMQDCLYEIEDIVEYWEARFQEGNDELTEEQIAELENTPTIPGGVDASQPPEGNYVSTQSPGTFEVGIARGRSNRVPCKDKITKHSFCKRIADTGEFAFNCLDFLKRKINKQLALKKMKACYECRVKSCSGSVRVF